MDPEQRQAEKQRLVEEYGRLFELEGLPRMAGLIIGYLLLTPSPLVSSTELIEYLKVTKGAISTTTRLLIQMELIERVSVMGERRDYFRLKKRPWFHSFKQELSLLSSYRQIAEQGLLLTDNNPSESREALQEMFEFYTYLEQEYPILIQRWEQIWSERQQQQSKP